MERSTSLLLLLLLIGGCREERSPDDPEAAAEALGAPTITAGSASSEKHGREDEVEPDAYVANMKDMEAFAEATRNLREIARRHPDLQSKTVFNLSEMDRMVANLNSDPRLIEAVADAGLTTREYAMLGSLTVFMGLATQASEEEAARLMADADIHPDNLRFFKENAARIRELNEAAQQ
jgi:hypothetical protein